MKKKEKEDLSDVLLLLTDLLNSAGLSGHFLETLESSVDKLEKILVGEICHKCKGVNVPVNVGSDSDPDGKIPWIQCESCCEWYHQKCVGLQDATEGTPFKCCASNLSAGVMSASNPGPSNPVQNASTAFASTKVDWKQTESQSRMETETNVLDLENPPIHQKMPPKPITSKVIKVNPLYLPGRRPNLVLADSQGRKIREKKLDSSGGTQCMTLPGMSFSKLISQVSQSNQKPANSVKTVTCFLGGNDLEHRSAADFLKDAGSAITLLQKRFPSAKFFITDVLPRADCRDFEAAKAGLLQFCRERSVTLVDLSSLSSSDFGRDGKHLNAVGIKKVCAQLKPALGISRTMRQSRNAPSTHPSQSPWQHSPSFQTSTSSRIAAPQSRYDSFPPLPPASLAQQISPLAQPAHPLAQQVPQTVAQHFPPPLAPQYSLPPPPLPAPPQPQSVSAYPSSSPQQLSDLYPPSGQNSWQRPGAYYCNQENVQLTPNPNIDPRTVISGTGVSISQLVEFVRAAIQSVI